MLLVLCWSHTQSWWEGMGNNDWSGYYKLFWQFDSRVDVGLLESWPRSSVFLKEVALRFQRKLHLRVKQARKTLFKTIARGERDWTQLLLEKKKNKVGVFLSTEVNWWKSTRGFWRWGSWSMWLDHLCLLPGSCGSLAPNLP